MTNIEALKRLAAAIIGDGTIVDDIPGETIAEVISYIAAFKAGEFLEALTLTSTAGTTVGKTTIKVSPTLTGGNSYLYKTNAGKIQKPDYKEVINGTSWNGTSEITVDDGHYIAIYEVNSNNEVLKFGQTIANANLG